MAISNIMLSLDESNDGPVIGSRRQVRASLYAMINYVHNNRDAILEHVKNEPLYAELNNSERLGMYLALMLNDVLEGMTLIAPVTKDFDALHALPSQWEAAELAEVEKYGITNY